jgi:DNA mismatch endonuclease (patch repair protein)
MQKTGKKPSREGLRERMSRVRAKDTSPEMKLRRLIHCMGVRYCLHVADLSGKLDFVFPKYSAGVLVYGCFWYRREGYKLASLFKPRLDYWKIKFERNSELDQILSAIMQNKKMIMNFFLLSVCGVFNNIYLFNEDNSLDSQKS